MLQDWDYIGIDEWSLGPLRKTWLVIKTAIAIIIGREKCLYASFDAVTMASTDAWRVWSMDCINAHEWDELCTSIQWWDFCYYTFRNGDC